MKALVGYRSGGSGLMGPAIYLPQYMLLCCSSVDRIILSTALCAFALLVATIEAVFEIKTKLAGCGLRF